MKRIVSLLLALVMLLSLCSFAAAEEKEVVTLRVVGHWNTYNHAEDRSDMTAAQADWYEAVRNLVPGYQIEIEWVLISENKWSENLPLMLAANDVPDIVTDDGFKWVEYFETGLFLDNLDPLLEEYGQDILKNVTPASLEFTKVGGHQVAIPSENISYKFRTVIREDWVEKLGYEVKDYYTLTEIAQIMTDVVEKDPDGNGVKDTIGLGTRFNGRDWKQTFMPFFGAFGGMIDDYYINDNNEMYNFNYSDEFRAALTYLADLWAKGVIDPECFVLTYDQALLKAGQGKSFLHSGWWNVCGQWVDAGLLELAPEAMLRHIYITSDDGVVSGMADNGAIWKCALISASCEHPELAIAFINYCNTVEGDNVGRAVLDENGLYVYDDLETSEYKEWIEKANGVDNPANAYHPLLQQYQFENFAQLAWAADTTENKENYSDEDWKYSNGFYRAQPVDNMFNNMMLRQLDAERDTPLVPVTKESTNAQKRAYWNGIGDLMEEVHDPRMYQTKTYGLPTPQTVIEMSAGLETVITDWVVELVNGTKDVKDDAVWAEYLNACEAKGASKILAAWVDAYNTQYGANVTAAPVVK